MRTVNDDDFCSVAQADRFFNDNLKDNLENENIERVLTPYGTDVNFKFALSLESYPLYVRYKNLDYVRQILKDENL